MAELDRQQPFVRCGSRPILLKNSKSQYAEFSGDADATGHTIQRWPWQSLQGSPRRSHIVRVSPEPGVSPAHQNGSVVLIARGNRVFQQNRPEAAFQLIAKRVRDGLRSRGCRGILRKAIPPRSQSASIENGKVIATLRGLQHRRHSRHERLLVAPSSAEALTGISESYPVTGRTFFLGRRRGFTASRLCWIFAM
jgi:hypothetical protein